MSHFKWIDFTSGFLEKKTRLGKRPLSRTLVLGIVNITWIVPTLV
jgi:hypothetical protein